MFKKKNQNSPLPSKTKVPNHVALVLDGNRRWARARGLPTFAGHKAGFDAAMKVARAARDFGVHTFSVYGFSTENWDRSAEEINYLMALYWKMVEEMSKQAKKEGIRFVHLGRKDRLPQDLIKFINEVEEETKDNKNNVFNAALDYGGRDEMVRAARQIVENKIPVDKIDEKLFAAYLDTGDQPYPYVDLFIRPSGEQRTSGLLLWQVAYAEYYWEADHLPDMTPEKLREAIVDYSRRRRRFGGNDKEEHLKFNPRVVAGLELQWRHALDLRQDERLTGLVIRYVREHYGLSRELAKVAGVSLVKALLYGEEENWVEAKKALVGLYEIVRKTVGLALEPKLVASIEVDLWKHGASEQKIRELLTEKFRFSNFQAAKSAHLAWLADMEITKNNWEKARNYTEKFYRALKERVA